MIILGTTMGKLAKALERLLSLGLLAPPDKRKFNSKAFSPKLLERLDMMLSRIKPWWYNFMQFYYLANFFPGRTFV